MSDSFYLPHRQPFVFYLCYWAFRFNDFVLKNKWVESKLWEWIKLELFYVDGQCQHSGNCCNDLMIVKHRKAIDTQSKFETLVKKDSIYSRFIPHVNLINSVNLDFIDSENEIGQIISYA